MQSMPLNKKKRRKKKTAACVPPASRPLFPRYLPVGQIANLSNPFCSQRLHNSIRYYSSTTTCITFASTLSSPRGLGHSTRAVPLTRERSFGMEKVVEIAAARRAHSGQLQLDTSPFTGVGQLRPVLFCGGISLAAAARLLI